jgi:hypothetical protein
VLSMRSFALAALAASALAAPAQAAAAPVDANDIVSVPTRDVDVKSLSRHRAIITLDGVAGHALIVSTDRREKTEALTLKRFERRFSKKLGLGPSPRMRVVTQRGNGTRSFTDYKVSRVRYQAGHGALVVYARTTKRSKHATRAARSLTVSNQSVSFAQSFGSAGPLSFTFPLTPDLSLVTTVYGKALSIADVTVVTGSVVLDDVTLDPQSPVGQFLFPIEVPGVSIDQGQLTLTAPSSINPGSVFVQATLTANGQAVPFSAQIASW